jgi:hypothetical protein
VVAKKPHSVGLVWEVFKRLLRKYNIIDGAYYKVGVWVSTKQSRNRSVRRGRKRR